MKLRKAIITAVMLISISFMSMAQRGFAIVVDPKSYDEARTEIDRYAASIEKYQHLKVLTVVDRWGVPDSIRATLIRLHSDKRHPIEGAVFIGDIPIAMLRDAQHMTSAFKMSQKRDRRDSSVPSDRYYDDFGLKFTSEGKDDKEPYFYYSLTADSRQHLSPDIYSGRIRPTDSNGVSRYDKLRAYLNKVVAEKAEQNVLNQMIYFSGHGYISESVTARIDEKAGLYEHFPWLKQQQNGIGFIDHNQMNVIKTRLMNELMRPELDYAILHHHGAWDTQYLSDLPASRNPKQAKEFIQAYVRAHLRSAKEKGNPVDSIAMKFERYFDVPASWFDNAFDPEICRKDSIFDSNLDLYIDDFKAYDYRPNCRVIMIDACFCGSFHKEDCIANEYIFNPGKTVVCIANTVNVLQDKWSDRFMGLLGLGACVGDVARYSGYLESHTIGDPTFCFKPAVDGIDVNLLLASANAKDWRKILRGSSLPDLQCWAIDRLHDAGKISSDELLDLFRTSPYAMVRIEALTALADLRDDNFIEAISLAVDDSYEMVQRLGLRYLGMSGDERLIPALIKVCISNNTSERSNFNAKNALSLYPEDKLVAEFKKQFYSPAVCYMDKEKVGKAIERTIHINATKWLDDMSNIVDSATTEKQRLRDIRTSRNYCPHFYIPKLLAYVSSCDNPTVQVALLESLGWHRYSYMAPQIADCALSMSRDNSLPEEVRNEALKTYNRIKNL